MTGLCSSFTAELTEATFAQIEETRQRIRRLRKIAFLSVAVNTSAIISCLFTFPAVFESIQRLSMDQRDFRHYCRTTSGNHVSAFVDVVYSDSDGLRPKRTITPMYGRGTGVFSVVDRLGSAPGGQSSRTSALRESNLDVFVFPTQNAFTTDPRPDGLQAHSDFYSARQMICCTCHRGEPGAPGDEGAQGLGGRPGTTGKHGNRGPPASSYRPPDPPPQCPCRADTGSPGGPGDKGKAGSRGNPGVSGADGLPGRPGKPGGTGRAGTSGVRGDAGTNGNPGLSLEKVGPKGGLGQPGLDGQPGRKGQRGKPGSSGRTGQQGQRGEPGNPGTPGREGGRGQNGSRGKSGPLGDCSYCPTPRLGPGYFD